MSKAKDMSNQKVGRLTVIERAGSNKRGDALWLCKCDCGNSHIAKGSDLRNGNTKSCGCLHREIASELNHKDIKGQKFNRLIAIEQEEKNEHGSYMWLCQCDCGEKVVVDGASLRSGHTQSCGCLAKEISSSQMKQFNEIMWQDEDYRKNMSKKMSELNNQWWQDEKYRENMSGENHPNYNPDLTDENRNYSRTVSGYNKWKQQVKELAHHTCDCCGYVGYENDGYMRSHHLNDYHSNKELATDINNGVCLCNHCHKEFHIDYMGGYKKECTKQDYLEFKKIKQN